jgi:hypothetical protein
MEIRVVGIVFISPLERVTLFILVNRVKLSEAGVDLLPYVHTSVLLILEIGILAHILASRSYTGSMSKSVLHLC